MAPVRRLQRPDALVQFAKTDRANSCVKNNRDSVPKTRLTASSRTSLEVPWEEWMGFHPTVMPDAGLTRLKTGLVVGNAIFWPLQDSQFASEVWCVTRAFAELGLIPPPRCSMVENGQARRRDCPREDQGNFEGSWPMAISFPETKMR